MPVRFRELLVYNDNGISISLKVEAPIGTVVWGPQSVGPNSMVTIDPTLLPSDCPSVLLEASDPTHGAFTQTFGTAPARPGAPSYMTRVASRYFTIGSFRGNFSAATEDGN